MDTRHKALTKRMTVASHRNGIAQGGAQVLGNKCTCVVFMITNKKRLELAQVKWDCYRVSQGTLKDSQGNSKDGAISGLEIRVGE